VSRIHKGNVGESLREVPDQPLCFGIVLLRQQAHIVGKADHPLEDRSGVVSMTEEHQIIDQPERAGEKYRLAASRRREDASGSESRTRHDKDRAR
jgi:hypothetical protein